MSSSSSDADSSDVMSLDDYVRSIDIPIEEIESATDNFADKNLVKETPYAKIYKGRLVQSSSEESVNIVVRICMQGETAINEVVMQKDLRHKHIVPIFKVSDKNDKGVIIYVHEENESLDKHLSSSSTLGWMQRLKICVGIARALVYLHYDVEENHSVIHGNIKSSKILLDHNLEPKLHGFAFAGRAKRYQLYITDKYNRSLQYMDPAYENTGGLNHKSDVFSFGVVLFEVLFGRDALSVLTNSDHNDNLYFARLARDRYQEKTLDDMIDHHLREQMSLESLNIFSETAYFCLKEQRSQRPDMRKVLQTLERALEHQRKHQNLGHLTAGEGTSTSSNQLKVENLDHLKIPLTDIHLATDNFCDKCCIGSGGFAMVYKAELDHFDGRSSLGEKEVELPKRRSTVAIKRIFGRVDGQAEKGFLAEIELLSKCKHPNIVSLIGFCYEESEMILIYEYATNGSLEAYLGKSDKFTNLTWAKRVKISIDIALGLQYLHKSTEDKECIIHRDIKSANILLDDKWEAKIADFGLSKLHPTYNQRSTLVSSNIGGTQVYLDPEYEKTGHLKTSSDIYSFGVVLCEILSGNLAYDSIYNTVGLPSVVQRCFNDGTIEEMVDPQIKEAGENTFVPNDGLNLDSLLTFTKIAIQCVAEAQVHRPTMEVIIEELEKSLNLQINRKDNFQISLEAIKLGTQDFSYYNCTGKGRFWRLYEGKISLANANGCTPVVVKRFVSLSEKGNSQFQTELKVLLEHKHKNIIGLVGYCNEMGEKMIVYEHASNGTLAKNLDNADLTWRERLKIGLDVARGLSFLHTSKINNSLIHRDIKSSSILLDSDWRAKLSNLEVSASAHAGTKIEHIDDDNAYGSMGYIDPWYKKYGYLLYHSDIYSLGVVLLEILCGRFSWGDGCKSHDESLVPLAKKWQEEGKLNEIMFQGIKEQIMPRSLDAYSYITFGCIEDDGDDRPDASRVVKELTLALAYQEDYEIWKPKLPKDYKKLCEMSETKTDEFSNEPERIKDFYDLLYKGFLFQEGKAWFSLGSRGKRNVMISAKTFSYYTNRSLRKWRSISDSRFQAVAQLLDISNLKIRIKMKPQLLLPGNNYAVYLVFRFREPGKCVAKQMYVNLKYKRGSDNLHVDFATRREDGWMMIELCQILNYEEDTDYEVLLLESFSRCYCGSKSVYIQGIEFRTIDNKYEQDGSKEIEKYEDIQKLKEDQQVMNEKICFILSERKVVFDYSKVKRSRSGSSAASSFASVAKPFHLKYSAESRFQGEIELLNQQVFGIKDKIERQRLSPDTDYMCYLVFKLSEKCHGLHCPVKVRHGLKRKDKDVGLIYFRPPSPSNLHYTYGAPKERDDGWMEVLVWKFNSDSELRNDHIHLNLKFVIYEGTMSGLSVCGLEIRPM